MSLRNPMLEHLSPYLWHVLTHKPRAAHIHARLPQPIRTVSFTLTLLPVTFRTCMISCQVISKSHNGGLR